MTSSDVIAIIAVVVSALVSITSVIAQYKGNKLTLEAKRSELFFDKRLTAFQTMMELVYDIDEVFNKWAIQEVVNEKEPINEKDLAAFKLSFINAFNQGYEKYKRNVVYIPNNVAEEMDNYLRATKTISDRITLSVKDGNSSGVMKNAILEHTKLKFKMVKVIRKFLGDT